MNEIRTHQTQKTEKILKFAIFIVILLATILLSIFN